MRFRKSNHSVYRTEYHVVWIPRYRWKILTHSVKKYLDKMLNHFEGLDGDIEVKKVNVQDDHVHMIIIIPPRVAVSAVVQFIKSQTAIKLKEKFIFLKKLYKGGGIWSRGYCVSSVGLNEQVIT